MPPASPSPAPPVVFDRKRRLMARRRMLLMQRGRDAPHYVLNDIIEDVLDRLSFLRHEPARALVTGDHTGALGDALRGAGCETDAAEPAAGFDEERPLPGDGYDLIASLGTLDTVNDLPGALIHIRSALAPGGLMIAEFIGAGSLPALRAAMLAADTDRPSPRIHPQVDVHAGAQLLQRAGFADPVVDSRSLNVSFRTFDRLVLDLRAQGLSNVLTRGGPPLGKRAFERARASFEEAGTDGRTLERFEILTLSGWRR